ncbi:glycosyltransferase [bacterium]|nr:glycosyltransferase [bacterium]
MKVLYFTRTQSPHDLRFTQALAATEHQVFVLCLEPVAGRQWPGNIEEIEWLGINPNDVGQSVTDQLHRLGVVLEDIKPDLVHAGPVQTAAYYIAKTGFHPLVTMSWGSDLMLEADENPFSTHVTTYTLQHTDILVGDCACVGQKAESFGFNQQKYFQFPWGVDLQHFSPLGSTELRAQLGWQDKIVLLSNRSLSPLYGVDVILSAFAKANSEKPDLRLLLFGKGPQESQFRQLVSDYDLLDKVHFGGQASLEELPEIYRSADVYLSASHSDGSSVSLMEALACGLPVVVSDIPGNLEWIEEGKQGWLFKDGSVQELSQKMLLAASKVGGLDQMKANNRALAEERADWNKNFPVLLKAYDAAFATVRSHD